MKKFLSISLCFIALSLVGVNAQTQRVLQLPDVPSDLRDVKSRAAYVVLHFWDNMDFNDSNALADNDFMEQNFANYAGIMPHADLDSIMPKAADDLLGALVSNPTAYNLILQLADIYLYDYASPLRYETAYRFFVQKALADSVIDSAQRLRLEYALAEIEKNAPGSLIPDIEIIDSNGNKSLISDIFPHSPYTLLYLYDPDCSHCTSLMEAFRNDPILSDAVNSGLVSVLAVNIMGEQSDHASSIPPRWIPLKAVDPEFIDTEAFELPSLPVIYLVDSDMKIVLKEASPQLLLQFLYQKQK